MMLANKGDLLPVSAMPVDGTWPVGTARWEKRNIATEIPVWESRSVHPVQQVRVGLPARRDSRPRSIRRASGRGAGRLRVDRLQGAGFTGMKYTLQVAPEDCTGCGLCVAVCPAKDKSEPKRKAINLAAQAAIASARGATNFKFFLGIPEIDRAKVRVDVKGSQFFEPLFEFSGACAGCGETPYVKLLTQLIGDRLLIANATGCSSIYGGNLPTTPYCTNRDGRGPAWSNSLFEDNAEYGLGIRLAVDQHAAAGPLICCRESIRRWQGMRRTILHADQTSEAGIADAASSVAELRRKLAG